MNDDESENDPHRPRNQHVDDEADHSIIIEYIVDYTKALSTISKHYRLH